MNGNYTDLKDYFSNINNMENIDIEDWTDNLELQSLYRELRTPTKRQNGLVIQNIAGIINIFQEYVERRNIGKKNIAQRKRKN